MTITAHAFRKGKQCAGIRPVVRRLRFGGKGLWRRRSGECRRRWGETASRAWLKALDQADWRWDQPQVEMK